MGERPSPEDIEAWLRGEWAPEEPAWRDGDLMNTFHKPLERCIRCWQPGVTLQSYHVDGSVVPRAVNRCDHCGYEWEPLRGDPQWTAKQLLSETLLEDWVCPYSMGTRMNRHVGLLLRVYADAAGATHRVLRCRQCFYLEEVGSEWGTAAPGRT